MVAKGAHSGSHPDGEDLSGDSAALTPASEIVLEYIEPPEALRPFVTTFFYFRCDEQDIRDIQPAAVGSLMVYMHGKGVMHFDKHSDRSYPVSLLAPLTYAAPFEVEGPFHCIGASLSPLGWAALTGMPANTARDRLYDAGAILGEEMIELCARLRADYVDEKRDPAALCGELAGHIAPKFKPVNPRHMALMGEVSGWMSSSYNPDIAELAERTGYSIRQVQRLVERYFGVSPKLLIRKYRALRVVALLQDPSTTDEQVADLLNQFYDQSHLIREVRLFAGRTPARLGDSESPILSKLLDVRNFREIRPNVAPLPDE